MAGETNEELIAEAISKPKQTTLDGTVNVQHGLGEKLDALERLQASRAIKKRGFGFRFTKAKMPDAV